MTNSVVISDVILNDSFKIQITKIQGRAMIARNLFLLKSCADFESSHRSLVRKYEDGNLDAVEFVKRMTAVVKDYSFLLVRSTELTGQSQTHSQKWLKKSLVLNKAPLQMLFQIITAADFVENMNKVVPLSEQGIFASAKDAKAYLESGLMDVIRLDDDAFQANLKFLEIFFSVFTKTKTFKTYPMSVLGPTSFVMKYRNSSTSDVGVGVKIQF